MQTVKISLRPSAMLMAALFVVHVLAMLALLVSDMRLGTSVFLGLAITVSLGFLEWKQIGQGAEFVTEIELRTDGVFDCLHRSGARSRGKPGMKTVVLPWLVLLFAADRRRTSPVLIARDSVSAEHHRMLRLWLLQREPSDKDEEITP